MDKKLKRIRFKAKDEAGNIVSTISAISLVTAPAIERNFQLFSKTKIDFKVTNEEKMEITGPAMTPDTDILRQSKDGEYFYCYFTVEDVADFAEMFLSKDYHLKANFEHGQYFSNDIAIKELWLVADPDNDKASALGFANVKQGDMFITYKCKNPELWKLIKAEGLQGFSVELEIGQMSELEPTDQQIREAILEELEKMKQNKTRPI